MFGIDMIDETLIVLKLLRARTTDNVRDALQVVIVPLAISCFFKIAIAVCTLKIFFLTVFQVLWVFLGLEHIIAEIPFERILLRAELASVGLI